LVAAVTVALYLPALWFPYVWTDHSEIEGQTLVPTSADDLVRLFTMPKGEAKARARQEYQQRGERAEAKKRYAYFRPVKALTYGFDWAVGGGRPWSFHLTNLLLHAGSCVLLLLMGRRLWGKRLPYLAEAVALLHAVSPLHVEAAVWISARSDVLWSLFTLGGVLLLLRSRESRRPWACHLGTGAMVLLAMGSKESALATVGILLLVSVVIADERRPDWWRRLLGEGAAPVAALVAYLLYRLLVIADVDLGAVGGRPGPGFWSILHLFGLNLLQSFLPVGLTVADTLEIRSGPSLLGVVGALGWLAWLLVGLRLRRKSPVLLLCALGWLLAVAPVSQIVPLLHPRGERYLYMPAVFAELSLVWLLWNLAGMLRQANARRILAGAGIVALVGLVLFSFVRSRPWADERRLFAEAVMEEPNCAECWNNLAYAEAVRGRYRHASAACLQALSIDTRRYRTARAGFSLRWILAKSLLLQGRGHQAVPWIKQIIEKHGPAPASLNMLAEALVQEMLFSLTF
jgi:4-amino-4-deoxy-L-arabinose transferase-like glycosyltransferase